MFAWVVVPGIVTEGKVIPGGEACQVEKGVGDASGAERY